MVFVKALLEKEIPIYRKPIHFRVRLSPAVYFAGPKCLKWTNVCFLSFPKLMAQSSILSKYQKYPKVPISKTWNFNVFWHHLKTHTPLLVLHPPNQKTPCLTRNLAKRNARARIFGSCLEESFFRSGGSGADALKLCKVSIATGRRHQIRCHLAYIGMPCVTDGILRLQIKKNPRGGEDGREDEMIFRISLYGII